MNDLLDESIGINLKKGGKRDYSKLLLKSNPFPGTAISREVPLLNVNRNEIIHHFEEIIHALPSMDAPSVTTIIGDYGDGKTHLLKLFKHSINSQLFDIDSIDEENTFAIYVRSPGRKFLEYFGEVIEDVNRSNFQKMSKKLLWNYIKNNQDEIKKFKIGQYSEIINDVDLEDYLKNSMVLDLFKNIRKSMFPDIHEPDFIFALLFLLHPDYSPTAWRWFLGANLSADEKKSLLVESSLNTENAYKQYKNFLVVFQKLGITSLVFLVDELEKIVSIPGLQKAQYHDVLRHMIDDSPKSTALFLSVAPKQWDIITQEDSALARRISENTMRLKGFDIKKIRELISKHLNLYRTTNSGTEIRSKFPDCEPDIAPFTEEAIEEIFNATQGNVFANIVLARQLIDYRLDNLSKSKSISADDAHAVIEMFGD